MRAYLKFERWTAEFDLIGSQALCSASQRSFTTLRFPSNTTLHSWLGRSSICIDEGPERQKWRRSLPKCTRQLGRGGPARCPQNNGRLLELAALGSQHLRPNRRKTAQESSARGENRGHRGGTMRAEGALHTSVSSAWRRPRRWCGEAVALDKRRAAARLCSHPSALSAGSRAAPGTAK